MDFKTFVEAANGIEWVGRVGPAYPAQHEPLNTTLSDMTDVRSGADGKLYAHDEYAQLYSEYLKKGNPPLSGGFTHENLNLVLAALGTVPNTIESD